MTIRKLTLIPHQYKHTASIRPNIKFHEVQERSVTVSVNYTEQNI